MLLNNIVPQHALKDYVRLYRIIHFSFSPGNSDGLQNIKAYRPRIEHCLQFTPFDVETVQYKNRQPLREKIALFGQHTVLSSRCVGSHYLNFQVVFQPGVLHHLFKLPADTLTNQYTDAELFFSKDIRLVNEQLFDAGSYQQMIIIVENFLLQLTAGLRYDKHPVDRIAKQMTDPQNMRSIDWYVKQSNLCYRQFDRMFKVRTGITPKEYSSLVRLDQAYLLKNRSPQKDWLAIALDSGFYDYQHLSKEYKKFTGYTPAAFFELEQKAPERYFGDYEQ